MRECENANKIMSVSENQVSLYTQRIGEPGAIPCVEFFNVATISRQRVIQFGANVELTEPQISNDFDSPDKRIKDHEAPCCHKRVVFRPRNIAPLFTVT